MKIRLILIRCLTLLVRRKVRFGNERKIMINFVEMDEKVTFSKQMDENVGPVIQINKFSVNPEEIDQFLKWFSTTAEIMRQQPGFISTQLHRGIAGSSIFPNYEVWESAEHFKRAVNSPNFQSSLANFPASAVMSPHIYRKIAVSGICVD
jgi:quinol monooxygenase YgiN